MKLSLFFFFFLISTIGFASAQSSAFEMILTAMRDTIGGIIEVLWNQFLQLLTGPSNKSERRTSESSKG
jgi:hypothetical protein